MSRSFEQSLLKNLHRIERRDLTGYLQTFFHEKNLLQNAIDAVDFSLIILDQDHRVVTCNQAAQYFLKKKGHSMIGESILSLVAVTELNLALKKILSEGIASEYMEVGVFDKTVKDYLIVLNRFEDIPIAADAPVPYQVLVMYDITDWKNKNLAEDQRKSIDSLQTLTAGIAHEIKNPLTAIDLHLQLIKRFISSGEFSGETKLHRWVNVVSEEIKRLEAIVNDFLFSFRPIQPVKTPQKLNDIIREVVEIFEPQCSSKGIRIKTDLDPEMETFLFDKDQIKQVLINLIHNSIEAIEENPQVEGKGLVSLVTRDHHQTIEAVISDNGVGIPTHKVGDIFKPFYTSKKMGTGLGLSIVSRIIHDHQGEIILDTDYREGAQFLLEFSRLPTLRKIKQISHQS